MKPVDLNILTIPRLKAYRKTLYAKIGPYEICYCGDPSCDQEIDYNRNNLKYIFLKAELERVNIELGKRQLKEYKAKKAKEWADVPTVKSGH